MISIVDFHTHRQDAVQALISVDPRHFDPQPGLWYSVGFHPWHGVEHLTDNDYDLLERCASHPQVLAVGETGMDRLRGPELEVQRQAFIRHLQLAQELGKPVVAHCVRTAQNLLAARHHADLDDVTLIIHGMRGNAHVARTLIDAGCYLSYGIRYNPEALRATPLERLLIETDDGPEAITDVATTVAADLGLTTDDLMVRVITTAQRILSP